MRWIFPLLFLTLFGCSERTPEPDTSAPVILIGLGNIFITQELTASSGGEVTILNHDDSVHIIASQSAPGAFDNTGSFYVVVPAHEAGVMTLPEAQVGDVFYYYSDTLRETMTPTGGSITIQ